MGNDLYISKERTLLNVQDYSFLREEGLKYIESLASDLWTDYNTHDPGITILEAICYAITELGYRTSFDIKDLMSDADGNINTYQTFFSARNILTTKPVTILDYRKILADNTGVKNAFLYPYRDDDLNLIGEPSQEVSIYADCKKDSLVYAETEHPIKLHGLYNVVIELEDSDEFGDMNIGDLFWKFATKELTGIELQLLFPDWNEIDYDLLKKIDPVTISNLDVKYGDTRWKISFDAGSGADTISISFESYVLLRSDVTDIETFVTEQFTDVNNITEILKTYQKKIEAITDILSEAKKKLHANRNLCEDFVKLETICTEEIAFCADVEVSADADIEEVYANILFQLENYLNPEIKFYSLSELVAEGISSDEIFDGPALEHGFIKSDELASAKPRTNIYVSDIINLIMDTEGVVSVKNVLLTKYDEDGNAEQPSQKWCLEIKEGCKATLNMYRSKVLFYKGKLPFKANTDEVLDTLKYLHGIEQRNKLIDSTSDLEIPDGNDRELDDFLSVQYEFPVTYGIGYAGLPSTSTNERKALAKQLKAYLLFYDQLLANFFAQLANAKELFSINKDVKQTYFAKYMNDIKGVDEIYKDSANLELIFNKPQSGEAETVTKTRSTLLENSDLFYYRRNKFLDHLISRFAESFNDYVLMLYTYKNADEYEEIDADELIEDKIDFLNDYPVISRERGMAFDYLSASWNTDNVSGFEKRISRLAGIDDFTRRFLFCIKNIDIRKTDASPVKYYFNVIGEDGSILLTSLKEYDSYSELESLVKMIPDNVTSEFRYMHLDISATEFSFELQDESNTALAKSSVVYTNETDRDTAILNLIDKMKADCPEEGMHLIEHILLRPRFSPADITGLAPEEVYRLFQVCLNKDCQFCGEEDPYSFRISIILPYWHERFESLDFRKYFETIARTEAPAHCLLRICWINNTLMNEFERAYKEWLEALKDYETDLVQKESKKERLRVANNKMIEILGNLHSEYPEAQLHDCETGVTNPVLLGSTILGTFKST